MFHRILRLLPLILFDILKPFGMAKLPKKIMTFVEFILIKLYCVEVKINVS